MVTQTSGRAKTDSQALTYLDKEDPGLLGRNKSSPFLLLVTPERQVKAETTVDSAELGSESACHFFLQNLMAWRKHSRISSSEAAVHLGKAVH